MNIVVTHKINQMLQYHLDNEELESKVNKFCKNPLVSQNSNVNDSNEVNIALSWWEVEKLWLIGAIKDIKLTEFNTFHMADDVSYMNRVMRVINDSTRVCKWGYLVYNQCKNPYDRDNLLAVMTSEPAADPKFTIPKSAIIPMVDGTNKLNTSNIRGWKNLSTVKFGANKVHVVTASYENFIPAVIYTFANMASGGIFIANIIINDTVKRYIKLLQSYFETVQLRSSEWSNDIFVCATGFLKCPKKITDYMIDHTEDLVQMKLVPDIPYDIYGTDYIMEPNPEISLSAWISENAF